MPFVPDDVAQQSDQAQLDQHFQSLLADGGLQALGGSDATSADAGGGTSPDTAVGVGSTSPDSSQQGSAPAPAPAAAPTAPVTAPLVAPQQDQTPQQTPDQSGLTDHIQSLLNSAGQAASGAVQSLDSHIQTLVGGGMQPVQSDQSQASTPPPTDHNQPAPQDQSQPQSQPQSQGPAPDSNTALDRNGVISYVQQHAGDYGLDPAAVLAVANQEGLNTDPASHWTLPGEGNISFGPPSWFGNGAGSDIIKNHGADAARWSWTPDGIDYWLTQVSKAAKGLTGNDAIAAVVKGFERPRADLVAGEVQRAQQQYDQFTKPVSGGGPASLPATPESQAAPPAAPNIPQDVSNAVGNAASAAGGAVSNAASDLGNAAQNGITTIGNGFSALGNFAQSRPATQQVEGGLHTIGDLAGDAGQAGQNALMQGDTGNLVNEFTKYSGVGGAPDLGQQTPADQYVTARSLASTLPGATSIGGAAGAAEDVLGGAEQALGPAAEGALTGTEDVLGSVAQNAAPAIASGVNSVASGLANAPLPFAGGVTANQVGQGVQDLRNWSAQQAAADHQATVLMQQSQDAATAAGMSPIQSILAAAQGYGLSPEDQQWLQNYSQNQVLQYAGEGEGVVGGTEGAARANIGGDFANAQPPIAPGGAPTTATEDQIAAARAAMEGNVGGQEGSTWTQSPVTSQTPAFQAQSAMTPEGNLDVTGGYPGATRFVRNNNDVIRPAPVPTAQPASDMVTGMINMARSKGIPDYKIGTSLEQMGLQPDEIQAALSAGPSTGSQQVSNILQQANGRPIGNQLSQQVDRVDRGLGPAAANRGVLDKNGQPLPLANPDIQQNAADYAAQAGLPPPQPTQYVKPDVPTQTQIAQYYDQTPSNPNDPQVKAAYQQFAKEVQDQYNFLTQRGVTFEPYGDNVPNPYANSAAMMQDLKDNNHLFVYTGGEPNPMLTPEQNFQFRAVHDYFGHAESGIGFGPQGEENAWVRHQQLFSPLAQQAMTTETRGQNSWVNFGPYGDQNRADPANTQFAEQKALILPDQFRTRPDAQLPASNGPAPTGGLAGLLRSRQSGAVQLGQAPRPDLGVQATIQGGGATLDPKTLQPVSLTDGFAVARPGGMVVDQAKFTPELLQRFAQEQAGNGAYVGTWVDNGKVYLDATDVVPDRDQALQLGAKNQQQAIYDFANGQSVDVPMYDRYYHGTAGTFAQPTADKFDPHGLFGPGYYLTDNPDVAGGVVANGGETVGSLKLADDVTPVTRYPGEQISPGYAQQRSLPTTQSAVDKMKAMLADPNLDPRTAAQFREQIARFEQPVAGPNVRAVDVPQGLNMLDADASLDPQLVQSIKSQLSDSQAAIFDQLLARPTYGPNVDWAGDPNNSAVYQALRNSVGGADGANKILASAGYDGISYAGGNRTPMTDANGNPIQHNVNVIFPNSIQKLRNAISGTQGGYVRIGTAQADLQNLMQTTGAKSVRDLTASDIAKMPGMDGATQGGDAIAEAIRIGKPFARAYQEYGQELQNLFGPNNLKEAISAWGHTAANSGTGSGGGATVTLMRAIRQADKEGLITPENIQNFQDLLAQQGDHPKLLGAAAAEQNPIVQKIMSVAAEDHAMLMPDQAAGHLRALLTGESPMSSYKLPSFADNTLAGAMQQTDPNVTSNAVTVDRHIGRLVMPNDVVDRLMGAIGKSPTSSDWYASMKSLITQAGAEQGITNPYESQAAAWEPVRMLIGGGVAEKNARKAMPAIQAISDQVNAGKLSLADGLRDADQAGFFQKHLDEGMQWAQQNNKPITTMDMYTSPFFKNAMANAKNAGIDLQSPLPSMLNSNPSIVSNRGTSFWQDYGGVQGGEPTPPAASRNGVFSDKLQYAPGGPTGLQGVTSLAGAVGGGYAADQTDQNNPDPLAHWGRVIAGAAAGGVAGYGIARGAEAFHESQIAKYGESPTPGWLSEPGNTPGAQTAGVQLGAPNRASAYNAAGKQAPAGVTPQAVQLAHNRIDQAAPIGSNTNLQAHAQLDQLLNDNADPGAIDRFMAGVTGQKVGVADVVRAERTGSMAGGVPTLFKVALTPVMQVITRGPTAAVTNIRQLGLQRGLAKSEQALVGGLQGAMDGAARGMQVARYGVTYDQALTGGAGGAFGFTPGLDVRGANPVTRAAGAAMTGLVRGHGAVSELSAGIGRGAALATGASPAQADEAGAQWAMRSGQYGYTGQLMADTLQKLQGKNPALNVASQIAIPFYKVGYNSFTTGVEFSPLGFLGRITDAVQGKPLDEGKLMHNVMGMGMAAYAFAQAGQGNITGANPDNPRDPAWSAKLPGVGWVPLRSLPVAGESLAQAADAYEAVRDGKGDPAQVIEKFGGNYLNHMADETWLNDMGNLFQTAQAIPEALAGTGTAQQTAQKELGKQGQSIANTFIPQRALINQAADINAPNVPSAQKQFFQEQPAALRTADQFVQSQPEYKAATPAEQKVMLKNAETQANKYVDSQVGSTPPNYGGPQRYVSTSDPTQTAAIAAAKAKVTAYKADPRNAERPTTAETVLAARAIETPAYKQYVKTQTQTKNSLSSRLDQQLQQMQFQPQH